MRSPPSQTLLTNLVIAWNTQRIQATLDRWRSKAQGVDDDWLQRMGPAHFAHVNFRGTLSFPVDRYREIAMRTQSSLARQSSLSPLPVLRHKNISILLLTRAELPRSIIRPGTTDPARLMRLSVPLSDLVASAGVRRSLCMMRATTDA
jgi:Tn3 transposase DDE domain